jgi:NAD(P)-dependent dehydrogenase (short-subunit alcohol dehydrogenase family)
MNERTVVVTGASAGLGRATARRFARAGADVALLARGQAGLELSSPALAARPPPASSPQASHGAVGDEDEETIADASSAIFGE